MSGGPGYEVFSELNNILKLSKGTPQIQLTWLNMLNYNLT